MSKLYFSPQEIAENYVEIGVKKANLASSQLFVLAILAGAFIAFASEGSNVAIHTLESVGLGKARAGALFSTGLMLVLVAGGELFTGNCLILISCFQGKVSWRALFRNWCIVYLGNFVGSILLAWLILQSGQLNFSSGLLGAFTIKTAAYKTGITFTNAFVIFCASDIVVAPKQMLLSGIETLKSFAVRVTPCSRCKEIWSCFAPPI